MDSDLILQIEVEWQCGALFEGSTSTFVGEKYIYVSVEYFETSARDRPIYRSPASGDLAWQRVSDVPIGEAGRVWTHPTQPDVVFTGGNDGLKVSRDAGNMWRPVEQKGLPQYTEIYDLVITTGTPSTYYGSFHWGVLTYTGDP